MTLIKNKYDYKEIKKASVEGRRLYACPDGNSVASVTTILDATKDKTHLIAWRKRVGETKAKEITTEAAGVGKIVKGVNTTPDVGVDAIKKQAKKFGFDVDNEGRPKHKFR